MVGRLPPRLGALTAGRGNNVLLVRLLAAVAVIVFHSYALTDRLVDEPLHLWLPELPLAIVGVDAFFFLSGLLVTKSWCERRHLPSFLAARALRIYPALAAAVLFSIGVAMAVSTVPAREFLASPVTIDFLWRNATAWTARYDLPGAFADNPFPRGVNGSLWTLPIEVRLYLLLAVAGVAGLLTRRATWLAVATLLAAAALWAPALPGFEPDARETRRLLAMFALGSVVWTWRAAIPVSLAGGAAALALLVVDPFGLVRSTPAVGLMLGYLIIVLAFHPRLRLSVARTRRRLFVRAVRLRVSDPAGADPLQSRHQPRRADAGGAAVDAGGCRAVVAPDRAARAGVEARRAPAPRRRSHVSRAPARPVYNAALGPRLPSARARRRPCPASACPRSTHRTHRAHPTQPTHSTLPPNRQP